MEHRDSKAGKGSERMAFRVTKAGKDSKGCRDSKVIRVGKDSSDFKVTKAGKDFREFKARKAGKALLDRTDQMERKALKAGKETKDVKAGRVGRDLVAKETKDGRLLVDHKEIRVGRVLLVDLVETMEFVFGIQQHQERDFIHLITKDMIQMAIIVLL
jgi:hypothetical protein